MEALMNHKFVALLRREYIDHRNGYLIIPAILFGFVLLMVILSAMGIGSVRLDEIHLNDIEGLGQALDLAQDKVSSEQLGAGVAMSYWITSSFAMLSVPFVLFFSLLGSLYEERRDRSILFWKSLPVSDTQEVLAKLVSGIVVLPAIFVALAIVSQLIMALILSLVVLAQGGPVSVLWPVGNMIDGWISSYLYFLLFMAWIAPLLAWIMMVSAYAPRMPFVFAILPPAALMIGEAVFFETSAIAEWVAGRFAGPFIHLNNLEIDGPRDLEAVIGLEGLPGALGSAFTSGHFWVGLVMAGAFLWGAVELRRQAN